jgi:hypothetical protein
MRGSDAKPPPPAIARAVPTRRVHHEPRVPWVRATAPSSGVGERGDLVLDPINAEDVAASPEGQ